ncbi:methylenetetrahydrofolate reductase [Myxacorys almedinensis]|uniref:Methylenetetrahydrofolate reductase n=1 Tax=Myxacorys almedinensis A TaxID=2690445 RepID=A0A8J7Z0J9_9CYAN|nr:methylenetetrahydrofolate reductase [Myxacorys almedinensis]NDJ15961.1 methylenetetrahydrofolate reductase [Myxacorys almedinensis A]
MTNFRFAQSYGQAPLSAFRTAAEAGEFLITAEVAPPKGADPSHMLAMATMLKGRVHSVNITDGSRAVMRMSSLVSAALLLQQNIEPVYQVACRDRNCIALQADLMGAHALGIRNVLALTGDPVKAGDHPTARGVFELESVRLLTMIRKLNGGLDWNDQPLTDGATDLFSGAAVDPQCGSWSGLQKRFERKLEAGAQFFQSQLITDFDRLDKFMTEIANGAGKPILAGIFLLKSAKNARFINRAVPGVNIPESIIERLECASDPLLEGVAIAAEQVLLAKDLCQGVHMMAVKREDLIPQVLDLAGIAPVGKPREVETAHHNSVSV